MSIQNANFEKAIVALWNSSGLDWEFKKLWAEADRSQYTSLHDAEAGPHNAFPYCVFAAGGSSIHSRMSGTLAARNELRDYPLEFHVHAKNSSTKSAKEQAAFLGEAIIRIYGGHPSEKPATLELDFGTHQLTQLLNDFGIRTGDDEHQWNVMYNFRLDIPVAE